MNIKFNDYRLFGGCPRCGKSDCIALQCDMAKNLKMLHIELPSLPTPKVPAYYTSDQMIAYAKRAVEDYIFQTKR